MQVELSTKKIERKTEKSIEVSTDSSKYEKDWTVLVERLIQALRDENEYVRWGAAGALGELGDLRAVEPLSEALQDKNLSVKEKAAWSLKKLIGDKNWSSHHQNIKKLWK